MSDTPETDREAKRATVGDATRYVVGREFAERLERQRDEWMAVSIAKQKRLGDISEQRDAYAETLRLLRVECYDFIDQRHPELAQEARQP